MCSSGFANTLHYRPQYRVGLEFNRNILSCRLYWLKLQHPWLRSNIPYLTLKHPNEIRCLESANSAPNKELHIKLINPICLSILSINPKLRFPQADQRNSDKTEDPVSTTNKRSPEYHPLYQLLCAFISRC